MSDSPPATDDDSAPAREAESEDWPLDPPAEVPRGFPHRAILIGLWSGVAGLFVLALAMEADPRGYGTHEQLGLRPCRMMDWTGVPCPGCGVTTSITHAVQGRPLESLAQQPLGFLIAVGLPLAALCALWVHRRGGDLYALVARRRRRWVPWLLGLLGAAWIYKLVIVLS